MPFRFKTFDLPFYTTAIRYNTYVKLGKQDRLLATRIR